MPLAHAVPCQQQLSAQTPACLTPNHSSSCSHCPFEGKPGCLMSHMETKPLDVPPFIWSPLCLWGTAEVLAWGGEALSYGFLYPTGCFSLVLTESITCFTHGKHLCSCFAEDVDPSVGRFRNMVQTAVVPVKVRGDSSLSHQHFALMNSLHD